MKKENPLSIWTFSYRKSYYLTHPWRWFNDIYWNIRNFWHRGRYGYAYTDVWNLGFWAPRVISEALHYLADHSHGYPGTPPWDTPERWRDFLHLFAKKMRRCSDFMDSDFDLDERNEYKKAFEEMCDRAHREYKDEYGNTVWAFELTPEDKELRNKYFKRQAELQKVDEEYAAETFAFFGKNLGRWWD